MRFVVPTRRATPPPRSTSGTKPASGLYPGAVPLVEALMNTVALESSEDLTEFDCVRKSVLNFGLPDIVHRTIDETSADDIKDEIKAALKHFEPRLTPDSVQAVRDKAIDNFELKIRFVVQADLRCEPVNVPVEFVADVDVDGNAIEINRL
jgi:type VI secretion system protein ImpF